jgi:glucose/arabinose dehydrogenase
MRAAYWTDGIVALAIAMSGASMYAQSEKPAPATKSGALDVEPEELRPGLLAHYRSLADKDAMLHRIDAKPAYSWGHSSPHPRIPPGPFEVVWSGLLNLTDAAPVSFDAYICGEVTMEVDGALVLQGRGESETAHVGSREPLNRPRGLYRLRIRYRALADLPARLQIGWQGPGFSREPLPAWHLKHLAADVPPEARQEQRAEEGRSAIGRLGCARCHKSAFPGVAEPPPGPSLADAGRRLSRAWFLDWLADPAQVRPEARMPALFEPNREGFVERWIITEHLLGPAATGKLPPPAGDHRLGRRAFVSIGCAVCHFLPDIDRSAQPDFGRTPLTELSDRLPADEFAAFLGNPHGRYPDGRMPRLPVPPEMARDIAAYLLMWSKPTPSSSSPAKEGRAGADAEVAKPPTAEEIRAVSRRLKAHSIGDTAAALIREKHCAECHPGLGATTPADIPLKVSDEGRGCLSGRTLPRFRVDDATKKAIAAYRAVAVRDRHPSPFASRQRLLNHLGCVRCHQRDSDRSPPIEAIGSTLGGAWLQELPFQRTPRLTYPHQKYERAHLLAAVREGVTGLRPARYSYRMPSFGHDAEAVVQALAEGDGDLPAGPEPPERKPADPTLGSLAGPLLAGFQGYACVSCHVWNGQTLSESDPGAVGTDLTRVAGRIRHDWFDRYLEGPARAHPGTPMPAIFTKGQPASLASVLDGDPHKQKDALWSYFARGKDAPSPKPPPPMPVASPGPGEPPLVAQIPIRLPDGTTAESICILYGSHDLFVYDLGTAALHSGYTGAQILREVQGRLRTFRVSGTAIGSFRADPPLQLVGPGKPELPAERTFLGYDRLTDGVRLCWEARFASGVVKITETLRLSSDQGTRRLLREFRFTSVPASRSLELRSRVPRPRIAAITASTGEAKGTIDDSVFRAVLSPDTERVVAAVLRYELPAAGSLPAIARTILADKETIEGLLERPGYRAIAYPRPKTASGEDRVMPSALAVHPKDGRVFVASMKTGEILALHDPTGDAKKARFDNYTRGLFQEAFSMLAEPDALYVLHRRNLTRIVDSDGDGVADRFDRVAALPHGIADTYDYGYGLVRDRSSAFVFSYAPYANTHLPGSGGALRLLPGHKPHEIAFGFRNPLGWCADTDGEIFFTDNQGEWVATNKLCHLTEGRFYGFPNSAQRGHASKPPGKPAVWVPYDWAKSINGVVCDRTGGKFGPFAGQFFLAELMFGGAIIRANVEKVNGEYQGACFPFWGRGLLGPLTLVFDPRGRLWVGGITEPGWMAQPDRGALFRIDYTGQTPFELQSLHVLPRGFRIVFTRPVSPSTGRDSASYQIEHYRYEYTGAYGSPELDRTRLAIERVELSPDGRRVDLITAPLVKDRVYMIEARGVRSARNEALVHPAGAYTLNEIPSGKP